ncbi:MAG TPA: response regulator [Dehalococcoidia bacterium]|nr:response regulator [Dehalococcoidia bacterium]
MKVLLVEDELALADVLARNLRARGYDVRCEPSARGAIRSLAQGLPDALVLDINLPDDSGWEVMRRLSDSERRRLRTVIISAAPISPKRIEEFRPKHCLLKPFPLEALARALTDSPAEEETA